jgi:hypothetical protein
VLNVRKAKTGWRIFAVAIGTAVAVTLATITAYASQPGTAALRAAAKLLPMSTSWPTPQRGIVLSYPSR